LNVELTAQALEDIAWFAQQEPRQLRRILKLIEAVRREPFDGIGKPEPLRGDLSGWWSRRIDAEHRLVYKVTGKGSEARLIVAQCRFHY
jgi:toxin YoeB